MRTTTSGREATSILQLYQFGFEQTVLSFMILLQAGDRLGGFLLIIELLLLQLLQLSLNGFHLLGRLLQFQLVVFKLLFVLSLAFAQR